MQFPGMRSAGMDVDAVLLSTLGPATIKRAQGSEYAGDDNSNGGSTYSGTYSSTYNRGYSYAAGEKPNTTNFTSGCSHYHLSLSFDQIGHSTSTEKCRPFT
jgi:hypothetical protein